MRELYDEAEAIIDDCEKFIKESTLLVEETDYLIAHEDDEDKQLALRATRAGLLKQIGQVFTTKQQALAQKDMIRMQATLGFSRALLSNR